MESKPTFNNKYLIFTNLLNKSELQQNNLNYRIVTFKITDINLLNKITESLSQHMNKYINDLNLLFEVSCPLNNRIIKTHIENVIITNFIKDNILNDSTKINEILYSLFGKKIDINETDSFLEKEKKAFKLFKTETNNHDNVIKGFSVNIHNNNKLCNKINFNITSDKLYQLNSPENKLITPEENNSDFYTLLKNNKIDSGLLIILNNIYPPQSVARKYLVNYSK